MSFGGPRRRCARLAGTVAAIGCLALALPGASGATILPAWGANLQTPNYDTANGWWTPPPSPGAVVNNNPTPGAGNAIVPQVHQGDDMAIWNTGSQFAAPASGQVREIDVEGCAVRDPSADSEGQTSDGFDVRIVNFESLTPSGTGYQVDGSPSAYNTMPFCSDSADRNNVTPSTVTKFYPVHMCIDRGGTVDFYDIGGFIPQTVSYANGVPFMVIAGNGLANGDTLNSYAHAEHAGGTYNAQDSNGYYGSEPNEELMMQVIEGTGDDAYGLCPGGNAVEPQNSNTVVCVTRPTSPYDPYGTCNGGNPNQPVRPPQNQAPPSIAVSVNGSPVTGVPVPGNRMDATTGTWTKDPNESFQNYAYQWEDCDSNGANCSPIGGQAGKNPYYYVTNGDVGHTIEVAVSATNNANSEGPVSLAATQVVGGPDVPVISVLKLNPSTWNAAGSSVITYYDSDGSTTRLNVMQGATVVKTLTHKDTAQRYGGNGISLSGLPAGNYELQVTSDNDGSVGQPATLDFTVTSATPVITNVHVNPSTFNSARGATITYNDNQAANATLRVVQCQGQSNEHKNKKNNKHKNKKKHSTRKTTNACAKMIKTLHHGDRAGNNGVKLTGVPAGHYELQIFSTYFGYKGTPIEVPFSAKLVQSERHGVRAASDQLASALVIA